VIGNKVEKHLDLNSKTQSRAIGNRIKNTSASTQKPNQERLVTGSRTPRPQHENPSRAIGDKTEKHLDLNPKTQSRAIGNKAVKHLILHSKTQSRAIGNKVEKHLGLNLKT